MKNKLKAAAAAVTAFALLGSALPVNFAGVELLRPSLTAFAYETVTYDAANKVLTLHGNVDKQEVRDVLKTMTEDITVNCEEGTVFPEDCSYMFMGLIGEPKILAVSDSGPIYSDDPRDLEWFSHVRKFDLRNADTSHVTNMYCMFRGNFCCDSILMNFDTSHVENMSRMFSYCRDNLTKLDLSGFDMSNVTDASEMFYVCCNLITIYADSNWNVKPETTDCTEMFSYCTKLTGGNGTRYSSHHTDGEYARIDGVADAPGYLTRKKTYNTVSFDEETGVLTLHGLVNKEEVRDFMCNPCKVRSIVCEEGTVLPEDCSGLFAFEPMLDPIEYGPLDNGSWSGVDFFCSYEGEDCTIDLSNADSGHVTNMSGMFRGNITNINFGEFDTSHVTDMSFMFADCPVLKTLDLSTFDTGNVVNMEKMFCSDGSSYIVWYDGSDYPCCGLESVLETIHVGNGWNVNPEATDCTNMFKNCKKLVGGNGTAYSWEHTGGDYAHIDGGMQNPGYLTYKARGNQARGASITLSGELAVNFFLELHPDTAQIKVTGPENSAVPTGAFTVDAALFPNVSGKPREATLSYPINATQAGETITLEFLDSSGNPLPVYNSDGVRFADDKLTYSAQQYIDDTPLYSDNAKLKALVGSLDNYCRAAHNFFFHKNDPVYGIEDVTIAQFEPYNYPLYGTEIALILNSKIEARIYSDNVIPEPFNGDGYLPTLFGTDQGYYFIYDIGAPQLASTETYQIGDTAFKFSPLTYGYYIMKKSDDESLKTLVRALYVYAQAAQAYPNGTD